jgi:HSP20 family protein
MSNLSTTQTPVTVTRPGPTRGAALASAPQAARRGGTPADAQAHAARRRLAPLVDVLESDSEWLLVADLPGVPASELDITLENGELSIRGQQPEPKDGLAWYAPASFQRFFRVPDEVDGDAVAAELKDGVLRVHLKKGARARPRRIEVRGS